MLNKSERSTAYFCATVLFGAGLMIDFILWNDAGVSIFGLHENAAQGRMYWVQVIGLLYVIIGFGLTSVCFTSFLFHSAFGKCVRKDVNGARRYAKRTFRKRFWGA